MGVSKAYKMYQVNINNGSPIDFPATQNVSHAAGVQQVMMDGGGQVDPSGIATMFSDQGMSFQTTDIKALLDVAGLDGKKLSPPTDKLAAYWQQYDNAGVLKSGSAHMKIEVPDGLLIPRSISASQGAEALIDAEVVPTFDGTNDPIIVTDNIALATRVNASQLWTLGKATINGVDIELQNVNIDFGIILFKGGGDGDVFTSFVSIDKRNPVITFDTFDTSKLISFVHKGSNPGGTCIFYLRKLQKGGTRVADATIEHISFTLNDYQIVPDNTQASKDGQTSTSYSVKPVIDGVNNIIVFDTTAAIA